MEGQINSKDRQPSHSGRRRGTFSWFMGQLGGRLPVYLGAILFSSVGLAGANVADSYIVKCIVTAAQTRDLEGVLAAVLSGFLLFILSRLLWRFSIVRYNTEGWKGIATVEEQVFSKALRLPYAYYGQNHSGEFMSKLLYDTERAGDIYSSRLRRLLDAVLASVVYLVPMFYYSWQLTVCLLLLSGLSLLGNSLLAPPMKRLGGVLSRNNAEFTEKLSNLLSGMEIVKLLPAREQLLADYERANASCYGAQCKTNRLSALLESMNRLFDLLGSLAFLGLGVWFVSQGLVTLGELAAVYTLYGSFRNVFLEIGVYFPQMMNCIANAEKLREFLEVEEAEVFATQGTYEGQCGMHENGRWREIPEKKNQYAGKALVVEHLYFAYTDSSSANSDRLDSDSFQADSSNGRYLLTDVSFEIKRGVTAAIVGESGCGKSTLAKLLLGFYQPAAGRIYIDGPIAYVPQEPYLYQMSIAENIACGRGDMGTVSMEEIVNAARTANAHDFIMELPEGYDTMVGERGNTLSGGERQRIAIARAILKGAPILLLDEATSALDNESERLVNEAVRRISESCTVIMIAHRESTIAMADQVIAL